MATGFCPVANKNKTATGKVNTPWPLKIKIYLLTATNMRLRPRLMAAA